MYRAFILLASARAVFGEILKGVCDPSVKPVDYVDVNKVVGLWYAYESIGDSSTTRCPEVRMQLEGEELVFNRIFIENGELYDIRDFVYYKDRKVFYPEWFFSKKDTDWHLFTVLDTDSVSFALLYLCVQITSETKKIIAWKFSKDPAIPEHVRARNNEVAKRLPELAAATWREHGRNNCPAHK